MDKVLGNRKTHIYQKAVFGAILLFSFFIRCIYISDIPTEGNQDEAMAAIDAWALSEYGTDHYGMQWPVHFQAWLYGQMSALLSYCMIPFIKLSGFSIIAVRMPILLISTVGIVLVYLIARKYFSTNMSLAVMAFAAINPWHFMQSRWALDCNFFPHVFLIGFYLLLCGLEKRKYLYLSMIFFGLTFYCYGIAIYSVPVFLLAFAIWCLRKRELKLKEVVISIGIFLIITLPEIITILINIVRLPTIETPLFSMPYFEESVRSQDILFLNFTLKQLAKNVICLIERVFVQETKSVYNALPEFGPMYRVSSLFMCCGIVLFVSRFKKEIKNSTDRIVRQKTLDFALLGFLIMGIWVGVFTSQVNINRINIIFYPLMFFTVYGIWGMIQFLREWTEKKGGCFTKRKKDIYILLICCALTGYSLLAMRFFNQYFKAFPERVHTVFNADFLLTITEADKMQDYDTLYITSNMGWTNSVQLAEIVTQYGCEIDALYYQELTNETGGRILLPYHERYCFIDFKSGEVKDEDALYIVHQKDLEIINTGCVNGYDIVFECGEFLAIDLR